MTKRKKEKPGLTWGEVEWTRKSQRQLDREEWFHYNRIEKQEKREKNRVEHPIFWIDVLFWEPRDISRPERGFVRKYRRERDDDRPS